MWKATIEVIWYPVVVPSTGTMVKHELLLCGKKSSLTSYGELGCPQSRGLFLWPYTYSNTHSTIIMSVCLSVSVKHQPFSSLYFIVYSNAVICFHILPSFYNVALQGPAISCQQQSTYKSQILNNDISKNKIIVAGGSLPCYITYYYYKTLVQLIMMHIYIYNTMQTSF